MGSALVFASTLKVALGMTRQTALARWQTPFGGEEARVQLLARFQSHYLQGGYYGTLWAVWMIKTPEFRAVVCLSYRKSCCSWVANSRGTRGRLSRRRVVPRHTWIQT